MTKRNRPAVDGVIASMHGVSRGGQPLTYSRAPARDLSPWIGRLYAAKVKMPPDYQLHCGVFNDVAMVHLRLAGRWTTGNGHDAHLPQQVRMLTGPHTRLMPVTVAGSFASLGYYLRAGAATRMMGMSMVDCRDRVIPFDPPDTSATMSIAQFDPDGHPDEWFAALEDQLRRYIADNNCSPPDKITARFENVAFANPSISVAAFAADCGVGERTIERIVRRDFGLSPKQVLRHARALDMASHLRGVADAAEGDALALRYFDQSHLIREFTTLFGMSPSQFVRRPLPMLTLGLELRQCRRLEVIERLMPGAMRPWE